MLCMIKEDQRTSYNENDRDEERRVLEKVGEMDGFVQCEGDKMNSVSMSV